ncbi:ornithine cyclodeaminase family protein [Bradyrhizobium sp. TZ2]
MKVPVMSPELLYLSNAHVQALQISAREAREAVLSAFRDNAAGRNIGLPKSAIPITKGSFISMSSVSQADGIATTKWVAVVPVEGSQTRSRINGLVCVSDYETGVPIAVLDGNSVTLIRTAAMSAAAAAYLAPDAPATIGLIGCGLQALSHLDAFVDLFPSLRRIHLLSRSVSSAEKIAAAASEKKLDSIISNDPDNLVSECEIVVSMVPSYTGLNAFLDARLLPSSSFASAVDGGRSWRPETLTSFDRLITDSLEQSTSPVDASNRPVEYVRYQEDLGRLASGSSRPRAPIKAFFGFRGFVIADLALAELAIRKARALGVGTMLPR